MIEGQYGIGAASCALILCRLPECEPPPNHMRGFTLPVNLKQRPMIELFPKYFDVPDL